MKTRFENLAMCTMFFVLIALIARNQFFTSSVGSKQRESSTTAVSPSNHIANRQLSSQMSADSLGARSRDDEVETPQESLDGLMIRVSLTNASVRSVKLRCDSSVKIVALNSGISLLEEPRLNSCQISASEEGISIGSIELKEDSIEFVPDSSPALWVNGSQYRGRLRLFRSGSHRIRIVNVVSLEDYLASVVDSEMPIAFGREARKAQCIASRTYALYQMRQRASHPRFDLFASEQSQKYLGTKYRNALGNLWAGESLDSREIVKQTAGLVCSFEGELFCTYFSATCGGRTNCGTDLFSDAATPLCGVECAWCRDSPHYCWTRTLNPVDRIRLSAIDAPPTLLKTRPIDRIIVTKGSQNIELTAKEIREDILPGRILSPMFLVKTSGDQTVISGRGHGHGVGMCQWGAKGLADEGRSAIEILEYYYPGCDVIRWSQREFGVPQ